MGTVRRIDERFQLPFTPEHAQRIEHHIAEHPQDKHGSHKYTPEEFGLDQATLKGLMPEYRHRFADFLEERVR